MRDGSSRRPQATARFLVEDGSRWPSDSTDITGGLRLDHSHELSDC